jgi:hypothetical protein
LGAFVRDESLLNEIAALVAKDPPAMLETWNVSGLLQLRARGHLAASRNIQTTHLPEAIQYRAWYRNLWH